jgi:hypothetical protein
MGSQNPNIMPTKLFKLHTKTENDSNHVGRSYTVIEYTEKKRKRKPISEPSNELALRVSLKI